MAQTLFTALIVLGCSGYAAWVLMPASWRRALRPSAAPASGCGGCDGCGSAPKPKGEQVVRIVRKH